MSEFKQTTLRGPVTVEVNIGNPEPALPKLTEAQGEMVSQALCGAAITNGTSQLTAIRAVLVKELRAINEETDGFNVQVDAIGTVR